MLAVHRLGVVKPDPVKGDKERAVEAPQFIQSLALLKRFEHLPEHRLHQCDIYRIEQ